MLISSVIEPSWIGEEAEIKFIVQKLRERGIAIKEGIFAGFSSGANFAAVLKLLRQEEKGANIVLTIKIDLFLNI